MRRFVALLLSFLVIIPFIMAGCGTSGGITGSPDVTPAVSAEVTPTPSEDAAEQDAANTPVPKKGVIHVYSLYNYEIISKFIEHHPDFPYEIKMHLFATAEIDFNKHLVEQLDSGGEDAPDIYIIEITDVYKYSKGDAARYAAPYKDLGIDVDNLVKEADIPQYVIDVGANPEGRIVGLTYHGTGGAFIYRRSIAKEVWGTDDPEIIQSKIGPGWEKFLDAAADLKEKGYGIVSGYDDIWKAVENSAEVPWVVDGRLVIGPRREAFLDLAKQLHDNRYTNNTSSWTDEWYADMRDEGQKKIFGFLGPSWFVEFIIRNNCGGKEPGEGTYGDWAVCEPPAGFFWGGTWVFASKNTRHKDAVGYIIKWITLDSSDTGLQYLWATGAIDGRREAAASGTVMRKCPAQLDILGCQDMFEVYDRCARLAKGNNITEYDAWINSVWLDEVCEYVEGRKTREQAISDFKQKVKSELPDIIVE